MLPKPENVKQDTKSYSVINKKINKTSKQTKLNTKKLNSQQYKPIKLYQVVALTAFSFSFSLSNNK